MRELVKHAYADENNVNLFYVELAGNSDETKPTTGIIDGSICTETDTGKVFFFNEDSGNWVEQFSFKS